MPEHVIYFANGVQTNCILTKLVEKEGKWTFTGLTWYAITRYKKLKKLTQG